MHIKCIKLLIQVCAMNLIWTKADEVQSSDVYRLFADSSLYVGLNVITSIPHSFLFQLPTFLARDFIGQLVNSTKP